MSEPETDVTVEDILQRIHDRLVVLGNKSRSKKQDDAERTEAGVSSRELQKLRDWIKFGGRNKKLRQTK